MQKSIVELRSINKLEDILTRTECIEPCIKTGDKIPSWDGELIVYKSKEIKKSNILGNIRIQVKGHMRDKIDNLSIKHSVSKSDLNNYMIDGGCIFFVVYMKNMDEFTIYYNSFLPYDLKLILDEFPDDKDTISINFMKYPKEDVNLQMEIFHSYIYNKNKQVGTVQASFSLDEIDVKNAKNIENLSFTLFQTGNNLEDMFKSAFKMPTYIYADIMKGKISVPVQKVNFEQVTSSSLPALVYLNDKCYYNSVQIRMIKDDIQLLLGKSFVCSINNEKMYFNLKGKLSERIKDLEFLLSVYSNNKSILNIKDYYKIELDSSEINENYENVKSTLTYMKTIQSALETLGVKEDLDCDLLKEQDEWILEIIIKSVIMKMLLISNNNLPLVINLKAGNITIPVWTKKEQDNAYRLTSLFQKKNLCVQAYNGEMISVHLAMKKEDFLLISNMNYELIINEILQQNYTPTVDILVNTFILNGINAFDENQNMDLYNMLLTISNWQVEKQESDINILNNYQLVKRKRKLRIEEISKLNTIKMNNTQIDIRLGVAILLQSKIEMEAYWEELDGEQKKRFKEFPICYFAKELLN